MRAVAKAARLFAQPVDLGGPAVLVGLLAVLGEAGAFERCRELGLQFSEVMGAGGRRWSGGRGLRLRGRCSRR